MDQVLPNSANPCLQISIWRLAMVLCLAFTWHSAQAKPDKLETVHLQLRWHHQFQFAGYYAALAKGYYRDAGLDVQIHAGAPGKTPVGEVLAGRAQFGEANSELLYQRLTGAPVVALASIFQHSPSVLLARADHKIHTPQDLIGKRLMLIGDVTDADFQAMFLNEGVPLEKLRIQASSYNIEDLIAGQTDAFNSYLTNEPYYLQQQQIPYSIIDPRRYGIDFYSDILFTTEQELKDHPQRVKAFRDASLRGWEYAMQHPDEIIDLLLASYKVNKTRAHLQYEASSMRSLILPDLIEIGHMNPGRWRHMADTFVRVGMIEPGYDLDGFLYSPTPEQELAKLKRIASIATIGIALLGMLAAVFYGLNRRLRREVRGRKAAEARIYELAYYDHLTGLPNRNLFYDRLDQAIAHAKRSNSGFGLCFIDLDSFKQINDNHGHATGDQLLHAVATRLQDAVRETDTVARFGGDEFVVLLDELDHPDTAIRLSQMLLETIRAPYTLDGKTLLISSSIGISLYPQDEENIRDLLSSADAAMYQGKQAGKDRLVMCSELNQHKQD